MKSPVDDLRGIKLRTPDFDRIMREAEQEEKAREKREREQPRINFMKAAKAAGFSKSQSEFMWTWLATKDHAHWNGMVG